MYNIQKAVSRLDYAPKLNEVQITDIQKGLGVFTPKPNKPVSFDALKETLKKAGYQLGAADITVQGTVERNESSWTITVSDSGQRFALEGPEVEQVIHGISAGATVEITGNWKTVGTGATRHEAISPSTNKTSFKNHEAYGLNRLQVFAKVNFSEASRLDSEVPTLSLQPAVPAAPIRVTSPGLTVYKGGAVTPRLYFIKQHLGSLEVNRQVGDVSVSYTPSQRVQLEVEVPFSRAAYDNGLTSGSESGFGNITGWAKYRFFRKVKTYGDRQAAIRVGLELPTGKTTAPSQVQISVPAFVRQQLTPINGGLAPHLDLAFSQADGRVIFGGNAEAIFRTERDGFRTGHEQRVSTDLEYVIPKDPHKPGGELFLILETTFVHRATGRFDGQPVPGSRTTEYFLAPGLQWAVLSRFVVEGSFQFPVINNTGPMMLRTDRNLLLGVKYLF